MFNDNVFLLFVLICVIIFISTLYKAKIIHEKVYEPVTCRKSTISNPMSNLLPFSEDPTLSACKESNKTIEDNLFYGFYRDQNDHVQREKMGAFYTLPDTSITGKKDEFANYLLHGGINHPYFCKRDSINCESYRDVRFNF